MSIDTDRFRTELLEERTRVEAAIASLRESHPGSLDDEVEEISAGTDNHVGDTATATLGREIDYTLGENSEHVLLGDQLALKRIEDGTYGTCASCGRRSHRRASRRIRGPRSASTTPGRRSAGERAGPPLRRARRLVDERALARLVRAAFTCGRAHAVDRAHGDRLRGDRGGPADKAHRHEPTRSRRRRARDRAVRIHHVRNSGIAFGFFSQATAVVIVLTGIAVAWMLVFFARSGARHPILPVALGLVIGGSTSNLLDRVRLGYVTDFLDFRWWPSFNLADSFIVIGVLVLLATLVLSEREPRRPGP